MPKLYYSDALPLFDNPCKTFLQDVFPNGFHATHKAFYGYHHQDETHQTHHDIIARFAKDVDQTGGSAKNKVGKQIDESDGAYQHALQLNGSGVLHQDDGIGNGTRTTKHGNAQGGDGNVVGIGLDFLVLQLHGGVAGLQHVETDLENNNTARYTETIGGNAKEPEQKLTGKGENHDDDESGQRGTGDDTMTFLVGHALSHSEEYGHGTQRIGQREKGSEAQECKR